MKISKNKKGFTLIEIIIAIAILGIVASALLSALTGGFSTIFSMGNKTRAIAKAQGIVDKATQVGMAAYTLNPDGVSYSSTALNSVSLSSNNATLHNYDEGVTSKYCATFVTKDGKSFLNITVVVFYQNGKRNVSLTSLIP